MESYAALIAIDWADRQHAVCLYDQTTGRREESIVKQTPESLQQWMLGLRARFAGQRLAITNRQARDSRQLRRHARPRGRAFSGHRRI